MVWLPQRCHSLVNTRGLMSLRCLQCNNKTTNLEELDASGAARLLIGCISEVEYEKLSPQEKLDCLQAATQALCGVLQESDEQSTSRDHIVSVVGERYQVLKALSDGKRPKEIAKERGTSEFTVRNQIRTLREEFGVHRYPEAVAKARRMGIVS